MPGRKYSTGSYRYGFNGKENDNEVKGEGNQQDYGFRIYDPRLVRFLSVDPLTRKYPWYTPYQFAGNTPIIATDLDGKEVEIKIGSVPNGTTTLRLIGSEDVKGAPAQVTVHTYPLTITDKATNKTTTYSVTRDALYINENEKPDKNGNLQVNNVPFEPRKGSSNMYEGEMRKTFGETELPSIRLRQNGSTSLPAEPVNSPWRTNQNIATNINIHVGGEYTTSTTPSGLVYVTGSEGCFTVVGGNEGIKALIADVKKRMNELNKKKMPTDIKIQVEQRSNVTLTAPVAAEKPTPPPNQDTTTTTEGN